MKQKSNAAKLALATLAFTGLIAIPTASLADPPIKVGKPIIKKDPPKTPKKPKS